jgi:hypothetical protein
MNSKQDLEKVLPEKIGGSASLDTIFSGGLFNGVDRFSKTPVEADAEMKRTIAAGLKPPFSRG